LKTCLYCAAEINDEAVVCKDCDSNTSRSDPPEPYGPDPQPGEQDSDLLPVWITIGAVLAVIVFIWSVQTFPSLIPIRSLVKIPGLVHTPVPQNQTCHLLRAGSTASITLEGLSAKSFCEQLIAGNPGILTQTDHLPGGDIVCVETINDHAFTIRDSGLDRLEGENLCKSLNRIQSKDASAGLAGIQFPAPTPTAEYPCVSWDQVSDADKGKTLCVYGKVLNAYFGDNIYYLRFSKDASTFRLIIMDGYYFNDVQGNCAMATGEIKTYGRMPYMEVEKDRLVQCQ